MERTEILRLFSEGFSEYLTRTKKSPSSVASGMSLSKAHVSNIKNGKNLPSAEVLFQLLEDGMRLDEAFGRELAQKLVSDYQKIQMESSPMEAISQLREFQNALLSRIEKIEKSL